jgi:NADPH-dependent glutamate synthase beta subunit-like oxidoreductase/NAD-dependent dihydropyrimidine dehydrogenase PreA subunit
VPSTKLPAATAAEQSFWTYAQQMEKLPPCQAQCPNSGDARGWLGIIAQHEKIGLTLEQAYDKAWEKLTELNPLPATIGRICPHPCEDRCTRRDKDGAVSINAMERFLGDWGISRALSLPTTDTGEQIETVGVIGSGPASLSFAYQMARRGYRVTIYERYELPGGMLRQAIPDYRLPRDVLDAEIQRLFDLNILLVRDINVGTDIGIDELRQRHTLIFLGLGAQAGREIGIPGEKGPGVVAGIEYLRQRKQGRESRIGARVAVIGGGNTAIDAARTARREGAQVILVYRRSQQEMPAAKREVEDALKEGVEMTFLAAPTRIIRERARVRAIEVQAMRLGEADDQGRRRPVPLPGQLTRLSVDTVIVAVSQAPDWHDMEPIKDGRKWLHTEADGKLEDSIWAGGDDRGPGIASQAIAQGRLAAEAAHAELRGEPRPTQIHQRRAVRTQAVKTDFYDERQRVCSPRRAPEDWLSNPQLEIDQTIGSDQAETEAARCMSCGLCFDCRQCFMYCNAGGFTRIEKSQSGKYFVLALDACEGCGKCIEVCPCSYLEARDGER